MSFYPHVLETAQCKCIVFEFIVSLVVVTNEKYGDEGNLHIIVVFNYFISFKKLSLEKKSLA